MRCPKCGSETIKDFCDFCGSQMPEEHPKERELDKTNNFESQVARVGLWTFLQRM